MRLSTNIRKKIGNFLLNRRLKRLVRKREFNNFDTSKTIGILFNASHKESYITSKAYVLELEKRGLKVAAVGIVDMHSEINDFSFYKSIDYFSFDDFDNFGVVSNEQLHNFIAQNFDIFIDFYNEESYIAKYIVSLSNASLRIGKSESLRPFYDFMIAIPADKDQKFFISQIEHYLSHMFKSA